MKLPGFIYSSLSGLKTNSTTEEHLYLSFKSFVFRKGFNRTSLIIALSLIVIQLIIFKYFYPFAGFINGDSYAYLLSAYFNLKVDVYPIGYPKFIRLFSVFSSNDTALVAFQYISIQVCNLILLYTLFFFHNPKRWIQVVLFIFTVLNPVYLYLANYVSSDSLFLTLSLTWIILLIWILYCPNRLLIFSHAIIILLAFTVRYNALFYPLISAVAMFTNRNSIKLKIIGLLLSIFLIGSFINFTANQYERLSKIKQFSPFSGWQMANNALYAYRFVDSADRKTLPVRFKDLDQDVRTYFDTTRDLKKHPQEMLVASTVYMWDTISPLRIYMNRISDKDTSNLELIRWSKVGPLFKDYATTLIRSYPRAYLQYYIWPNFLKYYAPPVEFLDSYSTGVDSVPIVAKQWFWLKSNKLTTRVKDMKVNTLNYYPVFSGMTNAVYVAMSVVFLILGGKRSRNRLFQVWILFSSFWIINLAFSVFASPIALRFQLFPFTLSFVLNMILLDYILKQGEIESKAHISSEEGRQETKLIIINSEGT